MIFRENLNIVKIKINFLKIKCTNRYNLLQLSRAKPGNPASLLYKAAEIFVCLSACLSVCLYPPPLFFRHDRRTATKFGTHIRLDMGLILS